MCFDNQSKPMYQLPITKLEESRGSEAVRACSGLFDSMISVGINLTKSNMPSKVESMFKSGHCVSAFGSFAFGSNSVCRF